MTSIRRSAGIQMVGVFSKEHRPRSKMPGAVGRSTTLRIVLIQTSLAAALALAFATPARAQGCAQCLDTTRSTPPSVQAAYRHAILLLGGSAATFFVAGGVLLIRRQD